MHDAESSEGRKFFRDAFGYHSDVLISRPDRPVDGHDLYEGEEV